MPKQLKGSLLYLVTDVRRLLITFWTVLVGLLIVSIVLNVFIYKEGVVTFQLSFPLYAVSAVLGQMVVKNSIPYLIKMGSTRKNIFKSIGAHFIGLSLFNAILASTVYSVTLFLFGNSNNDSMITIFGSGNEVISFNHIAEFFSNTWTSRVIIDLSIMLFLFVCGFLIGLMFYRFGSIGGISFIAIIIFTFIVGMAQGWLLNIFINIFSNITMTFFLQLILVSIVIYLLSYIVLRRLPIV